MFMFFAPCGFVCPFFTAAHAGGSRLRSTALARLGLDAPSTLLPWVGKQAPFPDGGTVQLPPLRAGWGG
ncbi:MAG: hypothetical protein CMK89_12165 [Pseudomonadales bacterium]|nr:hypothetical protein [Pseudomonadales bacterium]